MNDDDDELMSFLLLPSLICFFRVYFSPQPPLSGNGRDNHNEDVLTIYLFIVVHAHFSSVGLAALQSPTRLLRRLHFSPNFLYWLILPSPSAFSQKVRGCRISSRREAICQDKFYERRTSVVSSFLHFPVSGAYARYA